MDNVYEGIIVAGYRQSIILFNEVAKQIFCLNEEEALEWGISDLLKDNDHLLEIYYEVINKKLTMKELFDTTVSITRGVKKEKLAINFRCIMLGDSQGGSGNVLVLFEPLQKIHD